jgi:outer membrane lipoprotein SlyB
MKLKALAILLFGFGIASAASAGDVDKGAVIGGALGGGIGAGVGSKIGGTSGAIIGGAIGGGTGAAIGSSTTKKEPEKVIVKERVVEKEVEVVEVHDGPPGHSRGRKKGWDKHRD